MTILRPPAVAGMFYPAEAAELTRQIAAFLAEVSPPAVGAPPPKVLIAPHAGYIYSGPVAAHAYALLRPVRDTITRVVLMGPSHRVAFRGIATSSADGWTTPLGTVPLDKEGAAKVMSLPMVGTLDKAHETEHSLEVHLPFLQSVLGDFTLLPLVAGEAPRDVVAAVLDEVWGGPETLIVISTDLSHYLEYGDCQQADAATVQAVEHLDPGPIGSHQACGRVPVGGLLHTAKARGLRVQTLDVRNSGDTAGPKDRVVGYGAWALYEPAAELRAAAPRLLALARGAIEVRLGAAAPVAPEVTIPVMAALGASFVTLKIAGRLRGCIGSATAWRPLADDVRDNAEKAAFQDSRFPPMTAEEWPQVALSISVLTPPQPMTFSDQADLLAQLTPRVDGLIIADGGRRALFLPSVWEQLPNPVDFLGHLRLKAGMAADHWSPHFQASRFQAVEIS